MMAHSGKLMRFFLKWIVLPGLFGVVGYTVIGPMIGRVPGGKAAAAQQSTPEPSPAAVPQEESRASLAKKNGLKVEVSVEPAPKRQRPPVRSTVEEPVDEPAPEPEEPPVVRPEGEPIDEGSGDGIGAEGAGDGQSTTGGEGDDQASGRP